MGTVPETDAPSVFEKETFMTHSSWFFPLVTAFFAGAFFLHLRQRARAAQTLMATGALLITTFLIHHSVITGAFVANALVDPVFFLPFMMALVLVFMLNRSDLPPGTMSGAFLLLIAAALFAAFYPKGIIPPAPNKSGTWPFLFFISENCAYAFFGLSAAVSVLSANDKRAIALVRRLVILGFLLFSFAQVTGALWAFLGWGHPFVWGGRHLSSAAVWLFYIALIHLRYLPASGIRERRLTLAGGLLALFIVYSHLVLEMGIHRIGA